MNKRRILYVSEADIFGGAERYLLMVLEGLDRKRYDPTVALHPEAPRQLVEELEALKVPLCSIIPIRGKRDFFSLIMQRVLFKDKKPDIALMSEVSIIPLYEEMPDWIEGLSCFQRAGFEIAGLFPVARDSLRIVEYDVIMVNAGLQNQSG